MPYAANGQISQSPLDGGIEISEAQYQEGLTGILLGKVIDITSGFAVLDPPVPEEPEPEPEPEPEEPAAVPVSLVEIAGARLSVDQENWSVSGVERSKGIAGADLIDADVVWIFLSDLQPDTDYVVIPSTGVTKYVDFVEVSRPGLTEIAFIIQRVQ